MSIPYSERQSTFFLQSEQGLSTTTYRADFPEKNPPERSTFETFQAQNQKLRLNEGVRALT